MKTPTYYRAPLRSRAAITAWLINRADHSRRCYGPFVYNVKLRRLDTSFGTALANARSGSDLACESERYLAECRARWDDEMERAFEIATEGACERVTGDDAHRLLWNGNRTLAEWEFAGRSGGWLVLASFDGVKFSDALRYSDLPELLAERPFAWLRDLYRFLVQCDHDFKRPESEVEYLAASFFFNNCVEDIATDAQIAAKDAARRFEADERAHWEARDLVTA